MKNKILFISLVLFFIACNNKEEAVPLDKTLASQKTDGNSIAQANASKAPDLKYSLEQLDNTKGLSNSSVNCIFQDSQNLLWIGTWTG